MKAIEKKIVDTIRVLSAEAIQKANSGHPGLPIGAAPMAYTIFSHLKHNPKNPKWQARDRFVLSAGHASMLLYSLLHLFGYDLSIEDIKQFRQWESRTPGHPEVFHTPGVEASTGPLGQGIAMAVGMAMTETHLAAKFNRDGYDVVDNYTYVLTGDGCLMEGVSSEAVSLAGTLKLGKLIMFYDRNKITIEGSTDIAFTENVAQRFSAYDWQVIDVEDGEDIDGLSKAIAVAKAETSKPSLIIVHTNIAHGTKKEGLASAHGEPLGEDSIADMKQRLGWDYGEEFHVPDEVRAHFENSLINYALQEKEYDHMFAEYKAKYPELYAEWQKWHDRRLPEAFVNDPSIYAQTGPAATRNISGSVLNALYKYCPNMFGGSADLAPSNKSELKGAGYFSAENREGSNIHFGIREFAMAAVCNGMALYGGVHPFCATFMVFVDYLKPALRLSALMGLNVLYILTHDSIGVGEDGPTHQPIEQLASMRSIPNTYVFRPADAMETAICYIAAMKSNKPSVLALTRQNLPAIAGTGNEAYNGGYIVREPKGKPDVILMASGSEVELIVKAADILSVQGYTARLVSMPCLNKFDEQSEEYRNSVLTPSIRARVAVEAASGYGWHKYTGIDGEVISIEHFGASAPADILFREFGFTPENVAAAALRTIKRCGK